MRVHTQRPRSARSQIAAAAIAVSLFASLHGCTRSPADVAERSGPQPSTAVLDEPLARDLLEHGFQVSPGYPMVFGNVCDAYTYPALHSCFGNNPVSPYVIPTVKAWPEEFVGPTPVDAFGPVDPGYVPAYRLDPRDALVIYGRMPPPGKYMSVMTYLWTQHGRWKTKDYERWAATPNHPPMRYVFSTIPPDDPKAGRVWSFSSLGDAVNNVEMEQRSGESPFGASRYFIITPSASTDRAVRQVLAAQGVADAPGTARGPATRKLLRPRILTFKR
jgi:hypothetical protein